jgi:hypothetical protein
VAWPWPERCFSLPLESVSILSGRAHPSFATKGHKGPRPDPATKAAAEAAAEDAQQRTALIARVAALSAFLIERLRRVPPDPTRPAQSPGDVDEEALRSLRLVPLPPPLPRPAPPRPTPPRCHRAFPSAWAHQARRSGGLPSARGGGPPTQTRRGGQGAPSAIESRPTHTCRAGGAGCGGLRCWGWQAKGVRCWRAG